MLPPRLSALQAMALAVIAISGAAQSANKPRAATTDNPQNLEQDRKRLISANLQLRGCEFFPL
ncbi:MAG: hypothetical protein EHM62_01295 [Methylococcus sp.]|nr:MAG: hypothetical protein EHM62_01295 [Methylococcus sp.]